MKATDFLAFKLDNYSGKGAKQLAHGRTALVSRDLADYAVLLNDSDAALAYAHFTAAVPEVGTEAVSSADCRALFQLTCTLRPQHVLQVGTDAGAATHIAAALKHNELGSLTMSARVPKKEQFDFIFINSADNLRNAFFNIRNALGALAPNGTILIHAPDVEAPNDYMQQAIARLYSPAPWLWLFPLAPYPWEDLDHRGSALLSLTKDAL